jgi:hypothetical protein
MPNLIHGNGWWFDRESREYICVEDHAQDAMRAPARYRIDDIDLGTAQRSPEEQRSRVIRAVCARNFIRIRYHPRQHARLAWQFVGDPFDALEVLEEFVRQHDLASETDVTFTDFSFRDLSTSVQYLLSRSGEVSIYLQDWKVSRGV